MQNVHAGLERFYSQGTPIVEQRHFDADLYVFACVDCFANMCHVEESASAGVQDASLGFISQVAVRVMSEVVGIGYFEAGEETGPGEAAHAGSRCLVELAEVEAAGGGGLIFAGDVHGDAAAAAAQEQ